MLPERYQPLDLLGEGAMGRVLRARDQELGREVAIKILTRRFRDHPMALARFRREAQLMGRLGHPHVIALYDVALDGEEPYLVMELVQGQDLESHLRARGPLPLEALLRLASELGSGLDAMHAVGVVHRDLKPANVMLRGDGSALVMDLGLAVAQDVTALTQAGAMIGTPRYLPPELLSMARTGPEGDQFQLGAILFRAATGVDLIGGDSLEDILGILAVGTWRPFPDRHPPLPAALREAILRAVAVEPRERFASCGALAEAMAAPDPEAPAPAPPEPGPPARRGARGLLLALGLAVVAGLLLPEGAPGPAPAAGATPAPADPAAPLEGLGPAAVEELWALPEDESLDPARWGEYLAHLPSVRGIHLWVAAGGLPARLAPETRAELAAADQRFRARGLPAVLGRLQGLEPRATPRELPSDLPWPLPGDLPEAATGWFGTMVDEFVRARQEARRLEAEILAHERGRPSPFPGAALERLDPATLGFWRQRGDELSLASYDHFLRFPRGRTLLERWQGTAHEAVHAMTFAAARSVRHEPATRALVPIVFGEWLNDAGRLATSGLWAGPLDLLLGAARDRVELLALEGSCQFAQSELHQHWQDDVELREALARTWGRVLAGAEPASPTWVMALAHLLRIQIRLRGEGAALLALVEEHGPRLGRIPALLRLRVLAALSQALTKPHRDLRLAPEEAARLGTLLRTSLGDLMDDPEVAPDLARNARAMAARLPGP